MTATIRNIQPAINLIENIWIPDPEKVVLSNGVPVYLIKAGTQDVIKIELIFDAGTWFETKPMVAKFTNKMLKEGTQNFTSVEIDKKIDFFGAHLDASSDHDMAEVSLYSLNKHLGNTLPVLAEIIKYPAFPIEELHVLLQNQKQEFIINNEKVKYVARHKFYEQIFGKTHPYGKIFEIADFDRINRHDLAEFHHQHYSLKSCKIIVAGKIPDGIIDLLERYFGENQIDEPTASEPQIQNETPNSNRFLQIIKDNAIQSAIRIGKVLFNKKHPDYLKLKVLNTVLGGYFGSRLMTNIREEKGYTYGIGSILASFQHSGFFSIVSEVGAEVTRKAIDEIYHEIRTLQEDEIPEDELNLVRNYMLGSFQRNVDGPFALAENIKNLLVYDLNYDFNKEFIETIRNISAGELRDLARQYLDIDTLTEIIVGK